MVRPRRRGPSLRAAAIACALSAALSCGKPASSPTPSEPTSIATKAPVFDAGPKIESVFVRDGDGWRVFFDLATKDAGDGIGSLRVDSTPDEAALFASDFDAARRVACEVRLPARAGGLRVTGRLAAGGSFAAEFESP